MSFFFREAANMKNAYDVIVIGTGCGGSAAGALLSYLGYRTLIVEKNNYVGGKTATYEKDGFKLDHGHVLMSCEKGPHGEVLRITQCQDLIPKYSYSLQWATKFAVEDKLLDITPNFYGFLLSRNVLDLFLSFELTPRDVLSIAWLIYRILMMKEKEIEQLNHIPVKSFVSRYTDNHYFNTASGGFSVVGFGASHEDASAGEYIRIIKKGLRDLIHMGYPVTGQGISAIPASFLKAAARLGAEIRTGCPVENIIVEHGRIKGVRIGGETIPARYVISNAGIQTTVNGLVGPQHFDDSYVDKINNLTYSYSGISLKYALNKPVTSYSWGGVMPHDFEQVTQDMMDSKIPEKFPFMFVSPSSLDPSLAPEGKQILSVISGGPAVEPGKIDWTGWVKQMREEVEAFLPGLAEQTIFCEVSSPDDIARYAGRTYGDAVGVAQTIDQVGSLRPSMISPVRGLYYVGADVGKGTMATELASASAIDLYRYFKRKRSLGHQLLRRGQTLLNYIT